MHTNRRDLLLAGSLRRFHCPVLERGGSAEGPKSQSAARDHYNPPCEEPEHLHRSTVRGERPLECRGVHKRRLR
jgi:hypothetical protein